ncbi:oligosaccharide flippase family protein [Flavobacterium sp. XGLA_31]|uniref:oligosaccharide flippase family protein n=1 Tax=Flavobacterium sp. XGLA_31 TaxID=3447666 RepID=UPI003F2CB9DE
MNGIWYSFSKIIIIFTRIFLLMWTSRHLSPHDFGVFHVFNILITLFMEIPNTGLGASLIKQKNVNQNHINTAFFSYMVFALVFSGILWFGNGLVANFFSIPELSNILQSIFWLPLFIALSAISRNILLKDLEVKKISLIELFSFTCIYIPGVFIVYHYTHNYYALIYPLVAQVLVESTIFYLVKTQKYFFRFDKAAWNDLIHFGGWNTASRVVGMLGNQSDGIIIGRVLGSYSLGIYNRSYSIMSTMQNLYAQYLDNIIFADFAKMDEDKKLHLKKLLRVEYLLNLLIFPALLIVLTSSSEIVSILLGNKWQQAEGLLKVLTLGLLFRINYKITLQYLRSQGFIKNTFYYSSLYLVVTVCLMYSLSYFGLIGVTVGYSLGLIFQYFQLHFKVSKEIPGYTWIEFLKVNKILLLKFVLLLIILSLLNLILIGKINIFITIAIKALIIGSFFIKQIYHEINSLLKAKK